MFDEDDDRVQDCDCDEEDCDGDCGCSSCCDYDEEGGQDGWSSDEDEELDPSKPYVKLVGNDGNAYAIMGACQRAARKAKWTPEKIAEVMADMQSGDYDHLLATAIKYFDVH